MAKFEIGGVGATISPKVKLDDQKVGGEEKTITTELIQPTPSLGLQGEWRMSGKKEGLESDLFTGTTYGQGRNHSFFSMSGGLDIQRNYLNLEEETGASFGLKLGYLGLLNPFGKKVEPHRDHFLLMAHADIHPNGWAKKVKVAIETGIALPFSDKFFEDRFVLTQISISYLSEMEEKSEITAEAPQSAGTQRFETVQETDIPSSANEDKE